jgi:hypothetical protein
MWAGGGMVVLVDCVMGIKKRRTPITAFFSQWNLF